MHPRTAGKIVVGVDGAPRTIAALRWAASEALRRDAEVVAVHAWGSVLRPASYAPVADCTDPDESARRAAALLAAAVRTAFGAAPPVPVRELVDDRAVVPALLEPGPPGRAARRRDPGDGRAGRPVRLRAGRDHAVLPAPGALPGRGAAHDRRPGLDRGRGRRRPTTLV